MVDKKEPASQSMGGVLKMAKGKGNGISEALGRGIKETPGNKKSILNRGNSNIGGNESSSGRNHLIQDNGSLFPGLFPNFERPLSVKNFVKPF